MKQRMSTNTASYIIMISCRERCLCLQWIYIPCHVNRNYKARPLDRSLYVEAEVRSIFHVTSWGWRRHGFTEENQHYKTQEGKVFCGVTRKPRVQNGSGDRCNECGFVVPDRPLSPCLVTRVPSRRKCSNSAARRKALDVDQSAYVGTAWQTDNQRFLLTLQRAFILRFST